MSRLTSRLTLHSFGIWRLRRPVVRRAVLVLACVPCAAIWLIELLAILAGAVAFGAVVMTLAAAVLVVRFVLALPTPFRNTWNGVKAGLERGSHD